MINLEKTIVTSALPYINATPHLGNFVGSVLPADIYANYLRMKGEDVIFICGSDMHGTPIEVRAIKEKVNTEELAESLHKKAKELFQKFNCNFTYYGDTNSDQNMEITYQIFDALDKNGYIKEVQKELPYCNSDGIFLADRFIEGKCPVCGYEAARGDQCDKCSSLLEPKMLIEPHCTICGKKEIVFKKTTNLALDLKKLQPQIEAFFEKNAKANWSKNAVNEAQKYFNEGLKYRDISRNTKWGFSIPKKGFEDQVFYVWFDAPIGYIGITKEWDDLKWKEYWLSPDTRIIQFMGKDNIVFHTIIFPGMLIGSGLGYTLPKTIKSYEFLNWEGKKFSKSRHIGMDMEEALNIVQDPDYWRFALVLSAPENSDTDFTETGFVEAVNKIMNGKIGNLCQRVFTLINANKRMFDAKATPDPEISSRLDALVNEYTSYFDKLELREALRVVIEMSDLGNSLMSEKEPWLLAKAANYDNKAAAEFSVIMNALLKVAYTVSILMYPFIPNSSLRILKYFGINRAPVFADISSRPELDQTLEPKPIFEKLTDAQISKFRNFS